MAEALAAISAWWAGMGAAGAAGAGAAGAGAGAGAVGAGVGAGAAAAGTAAAGTAAAATSGSSLLVSAATAAAASVAGVAAQSLMTKKPDDLPAVPKNDNVPVAPLKPSAKDPGNVPGASNKDFGAGAAMERRRILSKLPTATQNTYAGDAGPAPVRKKRLLGGGITGNETTGA